MGRSVLCRRFYSPEVKGWGDFQIRMKRRENGKKGDVSSTATVPLRKRRGTAVLGGRKQKEIGKVGSPKKQGRGDMNDALGENTIDRVEISGKE